jgi:hypothetical protein
MCMNNSVLKNIQQSLNIIRAKIIKVDAETKIAALELIMSISQKVVPMARKLTTSRPSSNKQDNLRPQIVRQQGS